MIAPARPAVLAGARSWMAGGPGVCLVPVIVSLAAGTMLAGRVAEPALLALAVAAGLPHGGFDYEVGQCVFEPRYGARWRQPFLTGYVGLVGVTLIAWQLKPIIALVSFLLLSWIHFGEADAPSGVPCRTVRVIAHGGAVLVVPAVCHPGAVVQVLAVLTPTGAGGIVAVLSGPGLWLWGAAVAVAMAAYMADGCSRARVAAADLMLVAALFAALPPVIAFSLYFAVIHTPRALVGSLRRARSATEMIRVAAMTLLGMTLGVALLATQQDISIRDDVIRTAFLLLSALTVPHMWLAWRAGTTATREMLHA